MTDINNIYKMLDCQNTVEEQLDGIKQAQKITDLSLLIQPPANPSVWEQCAKIIYEKSDAELEPYLDKLLEWLQDLNWPGALTISERLKNFSGEKLKESLESVVEKADQMPNDEKLRWLDYLSELLDNNRLVPILSENVYTILKKHYHNWGYWYGK